MSSYSNKFILCVLVDGQVVQPLANGEVRIPFGKEYVLRFRNRNNRRAGVKFFIDGEEASDGYVVVDANSYVDVKRYVSRDAAFKLVSLDSSEAHEFGKGGTNYDKQKGVIEARFYLEKELPKEVHHHHWHEKIVERTKEIYPTPWRRPPVYPTPWYNDIRYGDSTSSMSYGMSSKASLSSPSEKIQCSSPLRSFGVGESFNSVDDNLVQDACTVDGGTTGQRFTTIHVEYEDSYVPLSLILRGYAKNAVATKVVEDDLEAENERLRQEIDRKKQSRQSQLAEENRLLREELAALNAE